MIRIGILGLLLLLGLAAGQALAAPFQHLSFDDGIPHYPPPPPFPAPDLPDEIDLQPWTYNVGPFSGSVFPFGTITAGSPIACTWPGTLYDTSSPFLPGAPRPDKFFVTLCSGSGPGPTSSAAIAQTGDVPADAHSIRFLTNTWPNNFLQVTFADQPIPLLAISSQSGVTEVAGDISAYAGVTGLLKLEQFQNPNDQPTTVTSAIDEISFSTQPVPEPGMMFVAAVLFVALVRP